MKSQETLEKINQATIALSKLDEVIDVALRLGIIDDVSLEYQILYELYRHFKRKIEELR